MAEAATLTRNGLAESQASLAAMETAMEGFQRTTLADLLSQQETLVKESHETAKIDDTTVRAARQEIIDASMKTLQARIDAYREDTAELIAGLEAQFEKLGIQLTNLQKPTAEDLGVQQTAESYLKKLETDGPTARALLVQEIADQKHGWNPIGRADRVKAAEKSLEEFDVQHATDIAAAKTAVEEAKAEVVRRRNKRIREAEFDTQFERFIALAQLIQSKLLENVRGSEVRMGETQKSLKEALTQKESLAKQLQDLGGKIKMAEDAVLALEQEKSSAVDETARSTVDTKLGNANIALADLNGVKQEIQVAHNALEAAAAKHEKMLASLQIQRDNQRAHARKLSIDSKARFTQAQNIVRVIQNTTQEDAASRLHSAGSSLDRTSLEIAARALIASERERLNMLKGHERDMKKFDEIGGALAEGRAQIAIEDAEIAARMKKNYGIDPMGASWLNLAQHMGESGKSQAPETP